MVVMMTAAHLQARLLLVRAAMNFSAAAAVGEGAEDEEETAMASSSSMSSSGGVGNRCSVRMGTKKAMREAREAE